MHAGTKNRHSIKRGENMERYFLGNNTGRGFVENYRSELEGKRKTVLLKGGPGTGKSSMLKKIAKEARDKGYEYELWYCSGDPNSLDGVYIKDTNAVVMDATAPHATGADLPVMRDKIYDLANSISYDKILPHREEIENCLKIKKTHFMRAYQHLKCALCHYQNQIELESIGLDKQNIRAYAAVVSTEIKSMTRQLKNVDIRRNVFTNAICPSGESVFYDHLRDKKVFKVVGNEAATNVFFEELAGLVWGGTVILDALDANNIRGLLLSDVAVVCDTGHLNDKIYESINLGVYENGDRREGAEEENNSVVLEIAFAVEQLNRARAAHLNAEKYFIGAMDFDNNARIYEQIRKDVFC